MGKSKRFFSYLSYWLNALEDHSLHSPFVYELYRDVIKPEYPDYRFEKIELERTNFLENKNIINITDLGAGSSVNTSSKRSISDIAQNSLSSAKLSRLIYRLIKSSESKVLLELGTSLGINSLYMAAAWEDARLTTLEGCEDTAQITQSLFKKSGNENIKLIFGDINKTLNDYLAFSGKIDFIYLDANHKYKPTIGYFNKLLKKIHNDTIMIIGDIHWSREMEKAWKEIKDSQIVTLSIDVFEVGICYFMADLVKQDYILEF